MLRASAGYHKASRLACACERLRAIPSADHRPFGGFQYPVSLCSAQSGVAPHSSLTRDQPAQQARLTFCHNFSRPGARSQATMAEGPLAPAPKPEFPLSSEFEGIQFPQLPEITTSTADATSWQGDLLLIGVFEDDIEEESGEALNNVITNPGLTKWDEATKGLLAELVAENSFKGSLGSKVTVRWASGAAKYIGFVGLGERSKATLVTEWGTSCYQAAGGQLAAAAKSLKAGSAAFTIGSNDTSLPDGTQ
ncbi:hypothetical protein WJX84_004920, partial [Apatococcus fuscideae]